MLSHLAGRYPEMDLGTCVLVLPWYSPLRLAGEIAMLSQMTRGNLHIGFGRGLARLEYDAFGVSMTDTRARFRECREVIGKALAGGTFTYRGEFFDIERPIELRPKAVHERVNLYGATSSPESAGIMARLDLPMIRVSNFPMHFHSNDFARWNEETLARGGSTDVTRPILIHAVLADTDEEADALAKEHLSRYFVKVVEHYEADADPWKELEEFKAFSKFMATLQEADQSGQSGPVARPSARRPRRDRVREAAGLRRPRLQPLHPAERDLRHAARLSPRDVGALRPRRGAPTSPPGPSPFRGPALPVRAISGVLNHCGPNVPTSPCPPLPPRGGGGTLAGLAFSPSPPLGAERAGVRWGILWAGRPAPRPNAGPCSPKSPTDRPELPAKAHSRPCLSGGLLAVDECVEIEWGSGAGSLALDQSVAQGLYPGLVLFKQAQSRRGITSLAEL